MAIDICSNGSSSASSNSDGNIIRSSSNRNSNISNCVVTVVIVGIILSRDTVEYVPLSSVHLSCSA